MDNVTLAEQEESLKVVYYGIPGSGKTTASAGLARLGPIVHVDAEAGLKRKPMIDHGIPVANINVHREITYDALEKRFWDVRSLLMDEGTSSAKPVGAVLDSTSEIHKVLLQLAAGRTYDKKTKAGMEYEKNFVALEDYGTNTTEMRKLIRYYRDLPIHVAFVCLERRDQDENSGEVSHGPDMTPKLAGDLMGYVDIVCHCITQDVPGQAEPEYWGVFRPVGTQQGKDRYHTLPPQLINPSMDRLVAYINGDLDVESDPEMAAVRARSASDSPENGAVGRMGASPAKKAGAVKKAAAR